MYLFNARTTWHQQWRLPIAATTFLLRSQWLSVKTTAGELNDIIWDHVCLNFWCSGRSQRPVRMLELCWWFAMCSGINSLLSSYNMYVVLFRYFPPVVKIKELIESGIIGKVILI